MAQVQKIAILGGGAGALSAAFYLSARPDWRERYDITVYQQGWRLGGKGASGRNARLGQRIEEHGLPIWFGFYANAFAMIRAAYTELARQAGAPLATWDQAFRPQDYIALAEPVGAEWRPWNLVLPRRPGEPGTGSDPVSPWRMALEALTWLRRWHSDVAALAPQQDDAIDALLATARSMPLDAREHSAADRARLRDALERASVRTHALADAHASQFDHVRRAAIGLEVWLTALRGMLLDGVFAHGFDAINNEDLRAWLTRHGGDPVLCVNSAPVHAM